MRAFMAQMMMRGPRAAEAGAVAVAALLAFGVTNGLSQPRSDVRISVTPPLGDGHVIKKGGDNRGLAQGEKPEAEFLQDFRLSVLEHYMDADYENEKSPKQRVDWPAWIQAGTALATTLFTLGLLGVGRRQAKIADRQAQIAQRQLDAARIAEIRAHRPRLYVRNIVMQKLPTTSDAASVSVVIANRGSEQAVGIEATCAVLFYMNALPLDYGFEPHQVLRLESNSIAGGNSTLAWVDGGKPLHSEPIKIAGFFAWRAYCLGKISYHDETGTRHVTGFARVYERRDGNPRFYTLDEPSYEYEE